MTRPVVILSLVRGADGVAQALLGRVDVDIVAYHEATGRVLQQAGIPFLPFDALASPQLHEKVLQVSESKIDRLQQWARQHAHLNLGGLSLDQLTRLVNGFAGHAADAILAMELLRLWVAQRDVRLVVVAEDLTRDNKVLVQSAQRYGVPSLHVMHGIPSGAHGVHARLFADHIAVFSEEARSFYLQQGVEPKRITITGNPLWDVYHRPPLPQVKRWFCRALNLDPDRPIVTYAMTAVPPLSRRCMAAADAAEKLATFVLSSFERLAQRHGDWQFLLRPHPSQMDRAEAIVRAMGGGVARIENEAPYDAVASADVVLCTESHFGVEALLLGKPTINVAPPGLLGGIYDEGAGPLFRGDDAVTTVRDADTLEAAVQSAMVAAPDEASRAARARTVQRLNGFLDGLATNRLCDRMLDMMRKGAVYCRPIRRYPTFERGLVAAVPEQATRVAVMGAAADAVAAAIRHDRPDRTVAVLREGHTIETAWQAVVRADPIPFDADTRAILMDAMKHVASGGAVCVSVFSGAGSIQTEQLERGRWYPERPGYNAVAPGHGFVWPGVEDALARAGLACVARIDLPDPIYDEADCAPMGWVICAAPAKAAVSAFAADRQALQRRADLASKRGLDRLSAGAVGEAIDALREATAVWPEDASLHVSLARALMETGDMEAVRAALVTALHYEPTHAEALALAGALGAVIANKGENVRVGLTGLELNSDKVPKPR